MHASQIQCETMKRLLARVGQGDLIAFGALYAMCSLRLRPYATRLVMSKESADDVLQESFIAIWRSAGRFDESRAAPMTWMIAIVQNKAIDLLRSNRKRERFTGVDDAGSAAATLCDPGLDPCALVEQRRQRYRIGFSLNGLGSLQRRAIELAFFHDLSHVEVALQMAIPLGTVKTYIRRGCIKLRKDLACER